MNVLTRNNVKIFGSGSQPILFAHGFGCDQTMWRHITRDFEEHYKIVLFDYVGCGQSNKSCYDPIQYSTLDGYAQDVLDICRALNLQEVIFAGHSVSGMIGLLAAELEPNRFSRIIMLGPSACYINDPHYKGGLEKEMVDGILTAIDAGTPDWAHQLAPVIMGNPDRPQLAAELSSLFCKVEPEVASLFARATFLTDSRSKLAGFSIPTLIMQCAQDVVAPEAAGQYIHEQLPASILIKLQATGHVPQLSAPEETVAVMKEYLAAEGMH
jgi:sigma-B regulation protein RsbQ